ncbi:PREDICTED: uncharacterized protein KIAA1109 homolog [Chrysochloris asiatica]|uniref:Uncharacterized protein KIAA1109 homolog n=1 Tax=Chrysochloris asiatica TaxID=185453 RepID=A0A9B0TRJ8_CHRAS|nr:PREDICTED: uncharacterized protein KIAA1109 homolog [Chrysochloris asiatica]
MEQRKNDSIVPSITQLEDFLTEHNSNVVWLLVATILSCGWIIYLTYYNSRNVGLILTLVLNRLYKHGYIHIGSFSFSVLSGKVMVREIYYITEDMSIRIQDGFIIFRWWKMYNPKQKQHDPKAETRLYITVNDFEFHVYNRSDLYGRLQELFGLEPTIIPPKKDDDKTRENGRTRTQSKMERVKVKTESQDPTSSWRSLIPVIKVNVSTGRLAFGNHYQPQTLCINFDDAFLTYTTKPPSSHLDQFMHIVKGKLENVRVMLVPSPRYVGLQNDEPPRLMGEGFVVMQSNDVDIYYYMDEPGLVPEETEENIEEDTSSEDCKLQDLPPCWGLDIVCGKGTDFNYGPWADRQRDCLWKFFFPPDYQVLNVSEIAQPGRLRQILAFELRMNIIADATIDLLFTKNRETNAVHVNVGAGSYLEINIPMTVEENGYTPAIKGQLLHVDATTSMQYRTLLEAEMLAFHINASYPRIWNMPQTWQCELEVYKATYHFIFAQKNFFTDLIQDWSSDNAPDIFSFVPYTWTFKIMFHQFEMIWAANQHNWIDCSTKQQENVYLAACGETLNIDFSLPFTDFVPATCNTKFSLRGEDVDLHLFLPDCHPSKYSLFMLVKNCHPNKMTNDTGIPAECQSGQKTVKPKWRNITQEKAGWVECWTVPSVMLTINYTWHPIYPQKADEQLKQSLSEMEETMLSVLRPSQKTTDRAVSSPSTSSRPPVDPSELPPDKLHVEMELSPDSQITLYGPLLNAFLCIKENYFGEDDMYMDFEEIISSPVLSLSTSSSSGWTAVGMENDKKENESSAKSIHPLSLRPWDITVLVNLYKVHGRLPVHGTTDGHECPTAFLERLCFEMKKGFRETMLQLVLSPLNVFVSDNYQQRPSVDEVLRDGHISLSGLQLRAHAMFSAEGLPLGSDSLEYAWLIDVQAGSLTAKVTAPQLAYLLEWGQTFVFHVVCREYELERPKSVIICQHGIDRRFCESKLSCIPGPCPASDDLKYTMTRLAVDGADIYIVEHGCATNVKMGAIRVANCNLHNQSVGEGISAAIQDFQVRQYIEQLNNCRVGLQPAVLRRAYWLEAGSANLGLITVDIALAADHHSKHEAQRHFLEIHDARTKRLWFLWPDDTLKNKRCRNKCGCLGGCRFFGGTITGLDFFKLDELTPSSSSAFSSTSAESDMYYGQSLLQPGEWIITKEIPKIIDGTVMDLMDFDYQVTVSFPCARQEVIKQGLTANSLLDRGMQLSGSTSNTPYTPLEKKVVDNTDDETLTEEWTLGQPVSQTRTTAIVEVKGTVDIVLTPLVAEALDRYIEAMVHCANTQHPAAIVDNLHAKVLREAVQNSKTTFSENLSSKQDVRGMKTEHPTIGTTNQGQAQTNLTVKQDNVTIKGLQANVSIPKVNLCLLQASVEESPTTAPSRNVTHVSLVALCFDRIATQLRMNRGVVEETSNNAEPGRTPNFDRYVHATKMQPQSSGSLRSNAGAEKGKEIAAKLNIHRVHGQLRGLDTTDIGTCAITAIPFEKSKVLFTLEELDEFTFVDETDHQAVADVTRIGPSQEKWGWIMFECGLENLTIKGGRQSGAVLYNTFGIMGKANVTERGGVLTSNNSSDSPTGSGYNTDVSDDNLPCDRTSPSSDLNGNSVSDEQDEGVESDDLKKDLPLMPPPPDSCSMKLTIKEIWFSFAAPTNMRSPTHTFSRQLNLLSTATPAVGAWLVPIDQLKSSLNKLETEGTLRICAVMGCIMTEALENKSVHFPLRSKYNRLTKLARFLQENPSCLLCNILHHYLHQANYSIIDDATMSDGLPALVTLKKGLVALARQWMKFIVVTPAFKGVSLHRPAQPLKPQTAVDHEHEDGLGLDNGGGLQSDTSADGAEFEFDAATVSEHTMLLEGTANRPPPGGSGPVTGAEIMRKLSKTHTHSDSALKIKGIHPYHSLSYTSGDTATDSPVHVGRSGMPVKESPRKESLLSYLTGSFPSLHNLLEGTPQRSSAAVKSSSLTRTGNTVATDMLSEHPLLSEPSSVSFYNWMSNAVGNRGSVVQESPVTKSVHNSLPTGVAPNLPTIPSASDFNTVLSSDQNTLDGTHSQHSTSQDDVAGVEEANQGFPAVQLADAQVVFKPLLSHTGIQSQDAVPLCYRMYFGEHLSFSGTLDCLRADIVDSDTAKDRKGKRARRQGHVNLPPLEFKPALMLETFSISAVVMEKSVCTPQNSTSALSFHDLNKRYYNTFHCNFTISCQSISQHVDMALVRLIHQFSTMIDDIKATQTDIKLSRYTAGSASPTPTFKTRKHRDFRSSDFSRSSRGSLNGGNRVNNAKNKRTNNENNKKESRNKNSLGRSERRTSKVSRKGSKDVADHMTIHMDDSDSITVSEQSEPSAECWQNMYKLLNFYSLISDPTGILEKSSETFGPAGVRSPTEPACKVVFENEQDNNSVTKTQRKRSLVTSEPQHVTLIVFGIGMVNRTHLEADIGGLTMESELKRIHGSFTLKEKMKDVLHQKMTETCATAHIGGVNIVLLEGITPNIQLEDFPTSPTSTAKQEFLTVVKCSIAKSQALYSAQRGLKTNNAAVFKVGAISINIPQHPATLHSMMVRSSHQLSKQISDLIRQPSTAPQPVKEDIATPLPSEKTPTSVNQTPIETNEFPQLPEGLEKKPIVLKFSAMLDGIAIGAALLPSLKAEYKMGRMRSHGMTGAQTRFTFELPNHRLRFTSKVSATDMSTIPPSASLNLPPVTMSGKYIMEEHDSYSDQVWSIDELPSKQGYYLQGNYLRCVAEVGSFEHNLTTDLLNHLVFVQKVFMKEVNEVIQKVSGGEQPIPLWNEHDGTADGDKPKILLYSLNLQFKGIQVTATTPSMRAVRFETGLIELELSNRLQTKALPGSSSYLKLFGKCQVDLNLALGQIVKHQVYEEAGSDFHQVAYFKTRIGLRNALREEISGSSDREAVLITLNRPIVYAQPVAFDRAVLFWLNYKAAYDNWNEQRMALHKDIHMATKEVVDMLPGIQQTSAQAFGTLFLQLTVNDLGICLPITNTAQSNHTGDLDTGSALVLTIESTLITACSSESLVSKGHFKNFCIRFADGFETSWDDWKPEIRGDLVMNACVVPDGTYEVCSRTTGQAAAESSSAGTWTLNVLWKMCGIDVHMDPNIGKRLNALGNTLTTLTGEEDIDDIADLNSVTIADLSDEDEVDTMSPTIHTEAIDYRRQGTSGSQPGELRGRKIVKRIVDIRELNEQAKVIDDLKKLGASEGTINQEIQRYQQLESVAVNDIRRDVRKKLRRSSMRAASLKDKWGLGYKPSYSRSKSISASGRPPLKRMERASSRVGEPEELPEIRVDAASPGPRVTFNIQDTFPEETELDLLSVTIDGPSHYSSNNSEGSCSVFSSPKTPGGFSPSIPFQPEESRRDDSLSSTSEDSEKDEKEEDHERERFYIYRKPSHTSRKKATGFAAVHQLFTERWPTTPVNRSLSGTTTERNIDFELDIRVEIDSGKCVLHPTTLLQEHDDISLRRSYDRSSRSLDHDSPSKKKKFQTNYASTTHLMTGKKVPSSLQTKPSDLETTVFYIPGVDVKLHYNSKTLKTESPNASRGSSLPRTLSKESKLYGMKDSSATSPPSPPLPCTVHSKTNTLLPPQPPPIPSAKGKGSGGVKLAKLYAWVALQSLPEEMVISPCLLDFLEKALETIPITPIERNYTAVSSQDEDMSHFEIPEPMEESTTSLVSSSTSAYSSFPVDVVVYVRVQPSQIKFSCLPVSRVECMLKLPSLDLVFSSNRGELETLGTTYPAETLSPGSNALQSGTKTSANKTGLPGSSGLGSPLGRSRHSSSQSDLTSSTSSSSGLSFTACMSDFSLYVFHPYGAGKQKTAVSGLTPGSGGLGNMDEESTSVTGRKDSLSINLEFVKVSLSRIRRSGGASFFESQFVNKSASKMDTTLINISAVCDIGSASFKYDMRRLSEILAFPRAWYRRSIARRLFLGDQTINLPTSGPGTPDSIEGVSQHLSPESSRKAYCRTWEQPSQSASFTHMPQSPNVFNEHITNSTMSPGTAAQSLKSPASIRSRSVSDSSVPRRDSLSKTSTPFKSNKAASQQGTPWETLVVFAINLKQLNVQMNMSNVMGNTNWTTSGLKSQGRLSVGSNRDREISMSVGLGRSQLDSKGGVVGGTIDVNALEMVAHISEHPNQQPSHKIQITMGSTEARVDYMGSSILMGIFSNADLKLQDEWKVNLYNSLESSMTDKSEIFVHGDLKWDIFQVMISRSTTPDLIKIGMKLQEFFTQQFDTSKRALSTWGPVPYLPPKTMTNNLEKTSQEQLLDAAHHRHWPGVLKVVSGCHISLFQIPLPEDGMQFGGSMSLHGNHMTLACFHGPNFRSKSWALFHLEEPNIAFWTEAQKIWEEGSSDHSTYIVQTLDFHLGHNTMVTKPCGALESPMATITKITRRRHENPPHGVASVKEWFNYVTATRNEELNLLRNVDANNTESSTTVKNSSLLSGFRGGSSYNHETETIFALPRMQLDFKSIHVQEPQEPTLQDASLKPKVECSVVTEFTDHICVTMDAELIMFLHDLVSAYLKEKEKAIFPPRILSTRPGQKSPIIIHDENSSDKDREDNITYTTVDWRDFMCNTWHLEPTLRLISWTGRKIDPVGVDYILQKLGFHHARTTIPKWLQRGVMDPLDKVLSVLIKKLGTALQDEKEKKGKDKEEH